jgi:hypothetical protein
MGPVVVKPVLLRQPRQALLRLLLPLQLLAVEVDALLAVLDLYSMVDLAVGEVGDHVLPAVLEGFVLLVPVEHLLLELVLLALELFVRVLDYIILWGVALLRHEDRPSVGDTLVPEVVELVFETTVLIRGVGHPRIHSVNHVFLPLEHLQGDLSAVVAFLALAEVQDEGGFGVIDADVELFHGVDGAVAVLDGGFRAEG